MKLVGYQEKREKRWCEGEREKTVRQTERGGRRKKGKKDQMGRLCVCLYVSVRVRQRKSLRTPPPSTRPLPSAARLNVPKKEQLLRGLFFLP